jgi:hypothetical protein
MGAAQPVPAPPPAPPPAPVTPKTTKIPDAALAGVENAVEGLKAQGFNAKEISNQLNIEESLIVDMMLAGPKPAAPPPPVSQFVVPEPTVGAITPEMASLAAIVNLNNYDDRRA